MIDKINGHYSMTNPASVYDEEALTSLELSARTAAKVNEVVEVVNESTEYMTEKLPVFVDTKIGEMAASGELDRMTVNALAAGKVDKNGIGQISYEMLNNDLKKKFTGDKIAVVGSNSITSENIVNYSVEQEKLVKHIANVKYRDKDNAGPNDAYLDINTTTGEITLLKATSAALTNEKSVFSIDFSTVTIANHEDLTTATHVNLWFDWDNNILHLYRLSNTNEPYFRNCFNLGMINFTYPTMSDVIIPVTVNGTLYHHPGRLPTRNIGHLSIQGGSTNPDAVVKIDFTNKKLIFPPFNTIYLMHNDGYFKLYSQNLDGMEIEIPSGASTYGYVVAGSDGIKILTPAEFTNIQSLFNVNCLYYLGYIFTSRGMADVNFPWKPAKTLSILGDSISTYAGWIPNGNEHYYNGSNCNVPSVQHTWWYRVMVRGGYVLNTNNSWSGSRVTPTSTAGKDGIARSVLLDNGATPDTIIVYLGINDFNNEIALGTYNGRGAIPTSTATFREAYANMLYNIVNKYHATKVYCCTLPCVERSTSDIVNPESNEAGVYLTEYNEAIREIARAFCVEVIDLECCGITHYNAELYMGDTDETGKFTHPNSAGHKLIADHVLKSIGG